MTHYGIFDIVVSTYLLVIWQDESENMRQNPDKKRFFTLENLKRLGWTGLFAIALIIAGSGPDGGHENKTQVPPVANPTPRLVGEMPTLTPTAFNTREPGTPVAVGTPVPVMHPEPPVTATPLVATPPRR